MEEDYGGDEGFDYSYSPPGEEAPIDEYNFDFSGPEPAMYAPGEMAPIEDGEYSGPTDVAPDEFQQNAALQAYIDGQMSGVEEAPPIGAVAPPEQGNEFGEFADQARTRPYGDLADTDLDAWQRAVRGEWDAGNQTGQGWNWTDPDVKAEWDALAAMPESDAKSQRQAEIINKFGMNSGLPANEALNDLADSSQENAGTTSDAHREALVKAGADPEKIARLTPEQVEAAYAKAGGTVAPKPAARAATPARVAAAPAKGQEAAFKEFQDALVKSNQLKQKQELMDVFIKLSTGPGGPQNRALAMALLKQIAPELAGQIAGGNITSDPATAKYTTKNGERTLAQMEAELRKAGWPGPTEGDDVVTAYKRTTQGDVTPIAATDSTGGVAGGMNPIGIPPATWDALGSAGQKLLLDAWEFQGGDRKSFAESINSTRPQGRASAPARVQYAGVR